MCTKLLTGPRPLPEGKGGRRFGSSLLRILEETANSSVPFKAHTNCKDPVSFPVQRGSQPLGKSYRTPVEKIIRGSDDARGFF